MHSRNQNIIRAVIDLRDYPANRRSSSWVTRKRIRAASGAVNRSLASKISSRVVKVASRVANKVDKAASRVVAAKVDSRISASRAGVSHRSPPALSGGLLFSAARNYFNNILLHNFSVLKKRYEAL